jgi:ElaB/YqjD/DUF883 family membrane-anchored ribosome-binding protein
MGVAASGRLRPYRLLNSALPPSGEPVSLSSVARSNSPEPSTPRGTENIMARKNGARRSNGNGHTVADDIANIEREIGDLMHDIEARIGKLQALAKRSAKEAAEGATDFVSDTVNDAADRARNGAHAVSDEASLMAGDAIRRIEDEVGHRPLLTIAIAAGIGFLAGLAGRRS